MNYKNNSTPPIAIKKPQTTTFHGHSRVDDYAWLRDTSWQEVLKDPSKLDPQIRAYLEAENLYTTQQLADTEDLQALIFQELKAKTPERYNSAAIKNKGFVYGHGFVEGANYPYIARATYEDHKSISEFANRPNDVILDGEVEQVGNSYFTFGATFPDPKNELLLWSYDNKGSEYYSIKVRDMSNNRDKEDLVINAAATAIWDENSAGFYYIELNDQQRPTKLFYHKLGTTQAEDILIYENNTLGLFMHISRSKANGYIFLSIHDHQSNEIRVIDPKDPYKTQLVRAQEGETQYELVDAGDRFYILTNLNEAEDFQIMQTSSLDYDPSNWQPLIEHKAGRLILDISVSKNYLAWKQIENAVEQIIIYNRTTGEQEAINFAEETYSLQFLGFNEYDADVLRFNYSSFRTPSITYDYDITAQTKLVAKEQIIPSAYNPDDYIIKKIMAPAADGELIPISFVYRKDTKLDGSAATLLYGYGSYGINMPAGFKIDIFPLLDRGMVYAIAHIRGSQEKGTNWYKSGKKLSKINTFTDFIAAADCLVDSKISAAGKIVAFGGSAGGLLMGAIANMAPEKFAAIIAAVPFVDALNTILDETLPLTPPEWTEWGNPITDKEVYDYMLSYSPYDNVERKDYPAILAIGGLTDPRVTYWEPAKWVAKLREYKTDDNMLLLKTQMEGGHQGASGRFTRLKEIALFYSFALKAIGYKA